MARVGIDEALTLVLDGASRLNAETVALEQSAGRVLAADAVAPHDNPPFDTSAMDGYAVRAADTAGRGVVLRLTGEARAGSPSGVAVGTGETQRISTGAPLPEGADAVVRQEITEADGASIAVQEAVEPGRDVRYAGEDVRAGETVIRAGACIGAEEIGVLAGLDVATPVVVRRPRVAIVGTGDELVDPGTPLQPGQIRDTNGPSLAAAARRAGAEVALRERVGDDLDATVAALERAVAAADLVLTAGGISVGPHDHVHPALAAIGAVERFDGVRLRPGGPVTFAVAPNGSRILALPGNPVSALVCFDLFGVPCLDALLGRRRDPLVELDATAAGTLRGVPGRTALTRCRAELRADGWHVTPTKAQGSHVLSSMLGVDALAIVPEDRDEIAAGEPVRVRFVRH